jgi:hypothetical protein
MKRVKTGDIIEIETKKGFAYAIYTHKNERYGYILQVFKGDYDEPLTNFIDLPKNGIRFAVFFPLQAAINRGIFKIAGNISLPDELKPYPIFRCGGWVDPKTKKMNIWWLRDGEKTLRIGPILTDEQRRLPILEIINDTMLIHLIETNWLPEKDTR